MKARRKRKRRRENSQQNRKCTALSIHMSGWLAFASFSFFAHVRACEKPGKVNKENQCPSPFSFTPFPHILLLLLVLYMPGWHT